MNEKNYIVVHCTASPQDKAIAAIREEWREGGWKHPGYHVLITASGSYVRLANDDQRTNGVRGHNHECLHISYIGGIDKSGRPVDNRTPEQKKRLEQLIGAWKTKYPHAKILGHRDFSPDLNGNGRVDPFERIKECPCFDAIEEYKHLK